jgi:hypothetical protein
MNSFANRSKGFTERLSTIEQCYHSGDLEGTMIRLLVLALILTASLVGQVEHAPTVAQCQADQRLWLAKLEAPNPDTNLPSYTKLSLWISEMDDCREVDPPNQWKYYNVHGEVTDFQAARMIKFLSRHGLWKEFIAEDAAGKR